MKGIAVRREGMQSAGFVAIPAFGEYIDSPLSVCMGKELAASSTNSTG